MSYEDNANDSNDNYTKVCLTYEDNNTCCSKVVL